MDRQEALDRAVLGLFQKKASTFLTTIYCSLRFSWDESIPTACTNGISLKVNPSWFLTLSAPMQITLLAHELWHVAYMHMLYVLGRDFRIWNMACDHAINLMLLEHGYHFDRDPRTGRRLGLADRRFKDMSADQIYAILEKEIQKNAGKIDLPFGDDMEEAQPANGQEVEVQITQTLIRAMTLSQMNPNEAGDVPGDLMVAIEKLLNPQLPWEVLLDGFFNELSEQSRSWRRPNRRFHDMYLPSNGGDEGLDYIVWAIDSSGSMSNEQLQVINTEIHAVKQKFNPKRMSVVSFDTEIRDVWEFTDQDDFNRLTIHGRGGTDMRELMEFAQKERPNALIVFSDMWCQIPPQPGKTPVLWLCLDNPDGAADYGRIIHMDSRSFRAA